MTKVDNDHMTVSVRGEAKLGRSFYRLKFDDVDGKIVKHEVWSDSLSAYLASTDQLQQQK